VETRRRMEDLLWENIEAYTATGKVLTPV
jgi:hypothetical protein